MLPHNIQIKDAMTTNEVAAHDSIEFKKCQSPKYTIKVSNCDGFSPVTDILSSDDSDDSDEPEDNGRKFRSQIVGLSSSKTLEIPNVT